MTMRAPFLTLSLFSLLLMGCIPAIHHPQVRQELTVPEVPEAAYRKALHITVALGGTIMQQDPALHMLQAYVKGTSSLSVQVDPAGGGSRLVVTEQVLDTYLTAGPASHLVQDFLTAYQTHP